MTDSPAMPPRARPDVVFRPLVDEWVLYDPGSGKLHVLNHTAALVWAFADGAHDPHAMVREIAGLLDGAPADEVLVRHVEEALEAFRREDLLA